MNSRSRAVALAVCLTVAAVPVRAGTFTVTNTNDTGPGSLRQAMLDANAAADADTITFAIGSGHQAIQPRSPLPTLTSHAVIDGSTQPGYAGAPLIEIDGALAGSGLEFNRGGGARALVLHTFTNSPALNFTGPADVRGCYIGTDATGTQARYTASGIVLSPGADRSPSQIGGTGPADGNLIGAGSRGIVVRAAAYIDGNRFGANAGGTAMLGPAYYHILVYAAAGPISIGEKAANYFSGGASAIVLSAAAGTHVKNNVIGKSHAGVRFPPNIGVEVYAATDSVISGNLIDAGAVGVFVYLNSLRATIRQNDFAGTGFAINLAEPWETASPFHTANDPGDSDTGANNLLNHPDLTRVTSAGGTTTIEGTYSGAPNRTITLDFYRAPACHSSGYGNGTWLASTGITTDAAGHASFTHSFPATITTGHAVSATATYAAEGTSEFSACRTVEGQGLMAWKSSTAAGIEGNNLTLALVRTSGTAGQQLVNWAATGGTATAGSDATPVSGTVTFADGETSKTIALSFPDDSVYEGAEQYVLTLTNVTGGAGIGSPSVMTVTIADNDAKPAIVVAGVTYVTEGNSGTTTLTIPVSLSKPAGNPISVSYASQHSTANSDDYVPVSGSLLFAPGETQKTLDVTIKGDTYFEPNDDFYVAFSSADAISAFAQVVIRNDETALTVSVGKNVRVVETDRTHILEVPITATAAFSGYVIFNIAPESAQRRADFEPLDSYYVVFRNEKQQAIRIRILGDDQTEADESFTITLRSASWPVEVGEATARVYILNDDTGVGPSDLSIPLGGSAPIVVDIGVPLSQPAAISIVSGDPGTISVPASVILPAGQSSINIDAEALKAPGHAALTVTMPPELEGDVFSIDARTYIPAKLVFHPATLSLYAGQTATVTVTLEPAAATALTIPLSTDSAGVSIPKSVTILAGGAATFALEAANVGPIYVRGRLPGAYGERETLLFGVVREAPVTPAILRISPPDGPSAGGTALEIHGANFVRDCALTFGGTPATGVQFVTAGLMTAITPAHDAGTVDVVLTCGERKSAFERGFTYTDSSPTLSHVAPSTGNVAGGTHVRIAGTNLRSSCWPFFDGVAAPAATLESPAAMLAVTPPHAASAVDVLLRCTGGEALLDDAFFYTPAEEPAASITTVTPLAAAPGEEVTITGTRFRPTDRVAFAMPLAAIVRSAPDRHVVVVPEVNAQRYSVDVTDINGRATTTGPIFNVLEGTRPRITAIAPKSAPAGAEIELQGEGFRRGYTFSVAEKAAEIVSLSYTRAIVRLPNGVAAGEYDVNVINSSGVLASIGPKITIAGNGLSIAGISRPCATTSGGGSITIRGSGFEGTLLVTFGASVATDVTIVDATTLTATVPAGEAGPAQIRIVRGGGGAATWTSGFRYTSPFDPNGCGGPPSRGRSVRH